MTDETVEKILTSLRSIDRAVVAARDALLERPQDDGLTDDELHARRAHPDWEYATTTCGRKQGPAPEPEGDGWEPNAYIDMGADPEGKPYPRRNWERFEYTDEEYWRRRRTPETKETALELTFPPENASEPAQDLQSASLGDRLRALGVRFQRGVSNSDPANDEDIELSGYAYWVTVQGIEALAAEADGMTAERDEWKRRRDAAVQECRFLHQDGLSRHDWHAKHCGAVEAADTLRAKVARLDADYSRVVARNAVLEAAQEAHRAQIDAIRAAIDREAAHGDAVTRCNLVAERFRTVLDGAAPKEPR